METFSTIENRRSIRHFDPSTNMPEEDFNKMMSAVILSPTSFNIQHWRFIRVVDPKVRAAIKAAAMNQEQVTDAAELIVMCANINAWQESPERYWSNAGEEAQNTLLPMLYDFYTEKPQLQRDEALRSSAIAAQTLMLAAKALNYDSNPMIGFDAEEVAKIIKLPEHHLISMLIAVGKAKEPANVRGGQLQLSEVLMVDSF